MISVAAAQPHALSGMAATPLKSALKRKHSVLTETGNDSQSSTHSKRPKVQFSDSDNKTELIREWNDKTLTLVREEVRRAIERHLAGDSALYDTLRQTLTTKPTAEDAPSPTLLRRYVIALTGFSSLMGKKCGSLVDAVLDSQWLGRDEDFVTCYRRLLVNLIATNGGYAHSILDSLVDKFVNLRSSAGRLPEHTPVKRSHLLDRLHIALDYIVQKVPSALGSLRSVLINNFPYTTDSVNAHVDYVSNLLKIITYAPALKSDILSLITERVVKIDVQIQVDIDDLEDDLQEQLEESLLQEVVNILDRNKEDHEDEEEHSDSDDDDDDTDLASTVEPTEKRLQDLKTEVTKLDAIIDLLFEFYHSAFEKGSMADKEALFDQLMSTFTRSILPTYRSRHIQFLLFHFGQTAPLLSEHFAYSLMRVTFDKNQATMIRRSAAAYLASFIARGANVPRETVHATFLSLGQELERLRQLHDRNSCGPDLNRYGVYYAIAQALLYIFCFRWRDLLIDEIEDDDSFDADELLWEPGVRDAFNQNIYSSLNPLKVCSPQIVSQFAIVARHLKFMYIEPLLEINKRIRLSRSMTTIASGYNVLGERETALSAKSGESMFQLDAYFPFDPYNLPRSKRWIEGDYNKWKPVPGMEEEENSELGSEEDDEDDEDDEEYDEPTETESDVGQ